MQMGESLEREVVDEESNVVGSDAGHGAGGGLLLAQVEQEAEIEATVAAEANYAICTQVINQVVAANQYANQDQTVVGVAGAEGEVEIDAEQVANEIGVSVEAVNVCLNNFATVTATATVKKTVTATAKKTVTPKATVHAKKKIIWIEGKKYWVVDGKTVTATATVKGGSIKTLPETGGASLLALGAGALLVGGGLVARRIAR